MPGEMLAANQIAPLLWRPWYLGRHDYVGGIAWFWPLIQHACELPDPAAFPVFDCEWSAAEAAMLERYARTTERLADCAMLTQAQSVKINLMTQRVTAQEKPSDDAVIGFAALLRQVFNPNEEASFNRVLGVIKRRASEAKATGALSTLKQWQSAHRVLLKTHDRGLIVQIGAALGLTSDAIPDPTPRLLAPEHVTPSDLINTFINGDFLHWGSARTRIEQWNTNEVTSTMMEGHMRGDASMLAHFYIGFAGVLRMVRPNLTTPP